MSSPCPEKAGQFGGGVVSNVATLHTREHFRIVKIMHNAFGEDIETQPHTPQCADGWYEDSREEWQKGTRNGKSMLLALCIPCIPTARLMHHLSMATYPVATVFLFTVFSLLGLFLVLLVSSSAAYALLALLMYLVLGLVMFCTRRKFRRRYNLQGSAVPRNSSARGSYAGVNASDNCFLIACYS